MSKKKHASPKGAAQFWSKVDTSSLDGCWPWLGGKSNWGYGSVLFRGRISNASRVAAILSHGAMSSGLVVCHACDNPICCRPSHLFIATQAENLRDCREKGRAVYRFGVDHHRSNAKVNAEQVIEARRAYANGETQTSIARRLGLHSATVSRAVRGKSWADAEQIASLEKDAA